MARNKCIVENGNLGKAIHDIGTPLMSNNNNNYFIIPPDGLKPEFNVEILKAVREIEKVFEFASDSCNMYQWCNKSPQSNPNQLCITSPWLKSREHKLCPFGLLWKHWELAKYTPIKS